MADLRITDLTALPEGDVAATDVLPIADVSASETKKVTTKDLFEAGAALADNGSIPSAKLSAISPANLGNSTSAAQFIAGPTATTGAFAARIIAPGDLPLATAATVGAVRIGTGITVSSGDISLSAATSATRGGVSVPVASGLAVDGAGVLSHQSSVTAQTKNGFTVNSTGHVTAVGSIAATDLPLATTTTVGGIFVGSGLAVTAAGELNHAASIVAGTTSGITYNSSGHITAITALVGNDLPVATAVVKGAVSVPAGALSVDGAGALTHDVSAVTPGSYSKVAVDSRGHVTGASPLVEGDIPALDASKITTGTLAPTLFGARSITQEMMGDYAFAYIQESVPSTGVGAHPIGMIWLQESTGQVSVWNGNSWMKTGASTLFNRNLRYGGSYNAATGAITGVTQFGTAEGFKVGDTIPAADDKIAGLYFVASAGGSSSSLAGGAVFDPGDWLLCQGIAGGWVRIDTLSGGGGGGSTVSNLDDLLDVTLTAPTPGDFLQLNNSGQWVNVSVLDEGTWT